MRSTSVVLASMAGCAGVVDLWAVTSLGGAFAGVVTGNLVTAGRAAGSLSPGELVAPLVAVAGFALGVAAWSSLVRWSVRVALVLELAVLVVPAVLVRFSGEKRQQREERDRDDRGACDGAEQGPQEGEPLR